MLTVLTPRSGGESVYYDDAHPHASFTIGTITMDKLEVESLSNARAKLERILEIYAPINIGRENAVNAMNETIVEFEAAVREDERGKHTSTPETEQAAASALHAASPNKNALDSGTPGVELALGDVSTADGAPIATGAADVSSTPREIGEMPPVPTGEGFKGGELAPAHPAKADTPPAVEPADLHDPAPRGDAAATDPFNATTPAESPLPSSVLREPLTLETSDGKGKVEAPTGKHTGKARK